MGSVKGVKCGFCKNIVETPCTYSLEATLCYKRAIAPPPSTPEITRQQAVELHREATAGTTPALSVQIGGSHYTRMKIQPITFIMANDIGFAEGNVIKYVSRWKFKNGVEDLKKARDMLDKMIASEELKAPEERTIPSK